jgi:hypothetical protein
MRRDRIEGLPAIGQVDDHRVDTWKIERHEIEIQHLVAALQQVGNDIAADLAATPCENDRLPMISPLLNFDPWKAPDSPECRQ